MPIKTSDYNRDENKFNLGVFEKIIDLSDSQDYRRNVTSCQYVNICIYLF